MVLQKESSDVGGHAVALDATAEARTAARLLEEAHLNVLGDFDMVGIKRAVHRAQRAGRGQTGRQVKVLRHNKLLGRG